MSASGLATQAVKQLQVSRNQAPSPGGPANNAAAIENVLSALSMYIPAEAMALFLAVSSALPAIQKTVTVDHLWVYWTFVFIISPGFFLLAYFAKLANSRAAFPSAGEFPWFRLMSSIIAFSVWGLCVPVPGIDRLGSGVLYGLLAMFVSMVLPSTEAIYNWILDTRKQSRNEGGG
jgi:hypothetical protein